MGSWLTAADFELELVDNNHLHLEENHSDADAAGLADDEAQQLSASIWLHLPQRELFPQAQPLSLEGTTFFSI